MDTRQYISACFLILCLGLISPENSQSAEIKMEVTNALQGHDTARAISLLNKEIDLDPNYYLNYYALGQIEYERKNYSGARDFFATALDKKSKHYESMYYLGRCLLFLGELDEAEVLMKKGSKKAKKIKDWFENGVGLVHMARENYSDADRSFRQAIVINEHNAEYHINLGDANFYQGIPSLATMEYEKALAIDTAGKEVYFHWAEACLEMKDYNCAIEKLKIVLSKDSTHAPAWNRAGSIYFKAALSSNSRKERASRFRDVIGSYNKYLQLSGVTPDSSTVRPFFELGMSYVNINAFDSAAAYLEKVLSIPYEPREIYFHYGKALWGARDYVGSGEKLKEHLEWEEQQDDNYVSKINKAEFFQLLGDSYYYRKPNSFSDAIRYYKISLEFNASQRRLVQNMAVAYHAMKSYRQAIEYYEKRIEFGIDSTSASIVKNAGYCALNIANNSGDGEDDLEELDDESEDMPEAEVDTTNYYLVAVGFMEQYLTHKPADVKVINMVGNTYLYQLADCSNGVKYFEKLLALEPGNCIAMKSLGYAYFGGVCTKNYSKALNHLGKAYACVSKSDEGACADIDMVLWIAQCYHLRGVDLQQANKDAGDNLQKANEWYKKVLKCEPGNIDAQEGVKATEYEF